MAAFGHQCFGGRLLCIGLWVVLAFPVVADSDGDGLSAWEEEFAGTNPTNSASVLRGEEVVPVTNGHVFRWQAVNGKSYTVWFKTNLADSAWFELGTGISGAEPSSTYTVVTDSTTGFIRVSVE